MGSRVLLADDSVTIQKVVGIIFANEDYELTVVDSGDAAMQKAREIMPDVILVDALMPGKNGYDVCSEIRRDPGLSHISLLLMTGAFEVVDEEKSRQSGADEFITKPFESQNLIDITGRLIALSRERKSKAPQVAAPQQPVAAPQPPPQPAVAATPVPPAPAAPTPPPADDGWGAGFEIEQTSQNAPAQAAAAPQTAPVKAATDDDLWGVFDMDAAEPAQTAPVADPAAAAGDFDAFSFDEAPLPTPAAHAPEEFSFEEEVPMEASAKAEYSGASGFEPFGEQEFAISEEPAAAEPTPSASIPLEEDFSTISFDEPEPAPPVAPVQPAAVPVPPPVPPVVPAPPEVKPAPAVAPAVAPEPVAPPPPAAAPAAATAAPAAVPESIGEEQLKQLLSKVSRDVIEKIVWEVVPDLAEAIIREEIRKLKEGGR